MPHVFPQLEGYQYSAMQSVEILSEPTCAKFHVKHEMRYDRFRLPSCSRNESEANALR